MMLICMYRSASACEWSTRAHIYFAKMFLFLISVDWTLTLQLSLFILELQLHPSNCWWVSPHSGWNVWFFLLLLFLSFSPQDDRQSLLEITGFGNKRLPEPCSQLSLIAWKLQLMSLMVFSQPFIKIWEGLPLKELGFFFIVIMYSFVNHLRGVFGDKRKVCSGFHLLSLSHIMSVGWRENEGSGAIILLLKCL